MRIKLILTIFLFIFTAFGVSYGQYIVLNESFSKVTVKNENEVNTENLEFSPFFYRDYIGFVFSNPKSTKDNNISEHYFDLAFAAKGIDGSLIKRALFNENLNSEFHEGSASFDNKKGILFFTRTYYDKKRKTSRDTIVRKIYQATERTEFADAIPVSFASEKYSTCHPTLSRSGLKMIYASNKPNGHGAMDLYASKKSDDWGEGINLKTLNTEANEIFPYLLRDSMLFFASDREGGYGGLDIYSSIYRDSTWTEPVPLPYPINTEYDDFGLIIDQKTTLGYFSSSRPGGVGKDDIYSFKVVEKLWEYKKPVPMINTTFNIIDKLSLEPQSNVKVIVSEISLKDNRYNLEDFEIDVLAGEKRGEILMKLSPKPGTIGDTLITGKNGIISLSLPSDKRFIVRTFSKKHEDSYTLFDPLIEDSEVNIILNPIPIEVIKPEIIQSPPEIYIPVKKDEIVVFNNIYYELNSAIIQQGAALELDALASIMLTRPTMTIELSAHTDSRGNPSYNQNLSINRAEAAKQYLVSKGIPQNRVKAIGYGESRIRNQCIEGVKCSEEEHKYNRRTEVKVISE